MAACYRCGTNMEIRTCMSCGDQVCPAHRIAQQPPEQIPQYLCDLCWAWLLDTVGADGLYPPIPDPDLQKEK